MKNCLLLIFLFFIIKSSSAQSNADTYNLTLNFGPSFIAASQLIIKASHDSSSINLRVYKDFKNKIYRIDSTVVVSAAKLTALSNFLKTYKFRIKSNIDTIGSRKVFEHGDSVLVYEVEMGSDGIDVDGVFNQVGVSRRFKFWSPRKETDNAMFADYVLRLADSGFTTKQTIDYLEQLEHYFPHRLGVKKLSDSPLIYKLYGDISDGDQDDLDAFLNSLPLHQKTIIDMSNFSGMGTMFYDWFEERCKNSRNIYWLNPTDVGLKHLYKIGISNRYI